ncbi:hypothetical protein LEP1GSC008_2489 [Leptospira kirschneri serovar Bulgarica str. Nikolaevo]|uniref:Uncharacterized protein n=1 Tax=Leptospira kirschneri serovar Bulgarica str. Nikolaevo TaxID=1240687 RepID=M6F0U8_9LEPT|nr:hypothetical protein LEP1GSC008_2489 [Leptospira kirschneri serovar Bulgarica str. Nikolaevo]
MPSFFKNKNSETNQSPRRIRSIFVRAFQTTCRTIDGEGNIELGSARNAT